LFKIATQEVSSWHFHIELVHLYFPFFYLSPFLWWFQQV
jgi:hypothetical protein